MTLQDRLSTWPETASYQDLETSHATSHGKTSYSGVSCTTEDVAKGIFLLIFKLVFMILFYDFFFFPPDLTTNIEIIDLCMFWLPDLSVQTQINNKAFLKTCISHIYLAHVSRMCRLLFFCFDCWEYCFIGTRNKVEQIRNDIFENMYLACVSRTCILHACAWRLCTSTSGDWD